jgi:hypothetical protein
MDLAALPPCNPDGTGAGGPGVKAEGAYGGVPLADWPFVSR